MKELFLQLRDDTLLDDPVHEIRFSREELLAKFCDIDLNEADKEKIALLNHIQEVYAQ